MKRFRRRRLFLIILLLSMVFAAACSMQNTDPEPGNEYLPPDSQTEVSGELTALLPDVGYEWIYNGFAEYGHNMRLDSISDDDGQRTYYLSGKVFGGSDEEAQQDSYLSVEYVVDENSLIQVKDERAMLDSKFDRLTLIKTPLIVGTSWQEQVTDQEDNSTVISGIITEIKLVNNEKVYTVRYEALDSEYREERKIKEGAGIQSFERVMNINGETFTAGYDLFIPSAEPEDRDLMLTLYFPLPDGSGVTAETRTIQLKDKGVAQAAMKELIAGPENSSLGLAVPAETQLLGMRIEEGICYVDFSIELSTKHWGGTTGEALTIAAIVNTLTEFNTIEEVQILIEGQTNETIGGHIVLDEPIGRLNDMIQ